jgi:hypothetical protein
MSTSQDLMIQSSMSLSRRDEPDAAMLVFVVVPVHEIPHPRARGIQTGNWTRPHQFNSGLASAQAEKKLNVVSGIS